MPDAGARLWVSQANADLVCAQKVYDGADHRTYCQAISKYQQTVEKSVKALAAAVRDAGIITLPDIHYYRHDLDKLISALRHLPRPSDNRDIQNWINRLLSDYHRAEINALCNLAPRKPPAGQPHPRSTEYPYENPPGVWTAPALQGAFSDTEVERFRQLAFRIYDGARQITSGLRRVGSSVRF